MIWWIPNPDQVSLHTRGEPRLADELCKVISKAQSLYIKQRFGKKGVQKNITGFFKAWITTDSIKIFSITFCTLVTVYRTCKITTDAFRIVLYVTNYSVWRCRSFVLKLWYLTTTLLTLKLRCNVVCYWEIVSLSRLWINKFKCSLKTSRSLVLATEHLKL